MILNCCYRSQLWIYLITPISKLNNPTFHLPNIYITLYSHTSILSAVDSACNLGVICDTNLSIAQRISVISKSCFHNIRDLRHIRNDMNTTTANTIVTSLIISKIDYCKLPSTESSLPATQTNRPQLVLNSAASTVTKTLKFHHITYILKSINWLKINERIKN